MTEIYDASGNLKVKYGYDAYGNCTVLSQTTDTTLANANPIRYRGYYLDSEMGLYYLNSRYYNPEWRRFISPDVANGINPQAVNGLNLYVYANNDPINSIQTFSVFDSFATSPIPTNSNTFSLLSSNNGLINFNSFALSRFDALSLMKNIALGMSEYSGILYYALTKNGQSFINYHQTFDGVNAFTIMNKLPHPVNSAFKGLGIGIMALDVINAGYESYQNRYSFIQTQMNIRLTAAKNVLSYSATSYITTHVGTWVGGRIGASVGSLGGIIGIAVGVVVGVTVGYLIDQLGDAIIDWVI